VQILHDLFFSSLSSHNLIQAIAENNVNLLQSVKGIGAKTAQRIIIELKDKLSDTEVGIKKFRVL
jgi:Holliday junction DNA helicase RuvA